MEERITKDELYKEIQYEHVVAAIQEYRKDVGDWGNHKRADYYIYYKKKLNFDGNGVPVAVFGDKYEMGFGTEETTGKKYLQHIEELLKSDKKVK